MSSDKSEEPTFAQPPGDNEPIGAAHERTMMVQAPETLGPFRLTRLLGRGGMGEVWQAFDSNLERDVAVKLMRKELLANEEAVKRFSREARAVARLNHPNIVQVYTFGDEKGILYMVMEMVEGETITQRMKATGVVPLTECVQMLLQAVEGLSYANARGIVHRDIKPSNLMITNDFRIKIADFGLAKMVETDTQMTQAGTTMGSPNYMSPEQARGEEADNRSDIYALGISFYQMLTGQLPFTAQTPLSVLLKQIQDPLPEPKLLRELADGRALDVIKKMTHKAPDDRFQTYGGLAASLAALAPEVRVKGSHIPTSSMPTPQAAAELSDASATGPQRGTAVFADHRTPPPTGDTATHTLDAEALPSPPMRPPNLAQTPSGGMESIQEAFNSGNAATRTMPSMPAPSPVRKIAGVGATALVAAAVAAGVVFFLNRDRTKNTLPSNRGSNGTDVVSVPTPAPTAAVQQTPVASTPTSTPDTRVTPVPTSVPVPTSAGPVVVPTMAPNVMSVSYLRLGGSQTPDGVLVNLYQNGKVARTLPAGTRLQYNRMEGAGQNLQYEVAHENGIFYVRHADAVTESRPAAETADRRLPPGVPTATPIQTRFLVLGTKNGAPDERVAIYAENKPTGRELTPMRAGTRLQVIDETQIMYKVIHPNGSQGYVLKGNATLERP
jgi:serine/threonine protein kinase